MGITVVKDIGEGGFREAKEVVMNGERAVMNLYLDKVWKT